MIKYFLMVSMFCTAAFAERFSIVQIGDVHGTFGSSKNLYTTNTINWIRTHKVLTNDTFGSIGGYIKGVYLGGDCYEDTTPLTNGYDPTVIGSIYTSFQMTNDVNTLIQDGFMVFVNDGNHDANNTNDTYGGTYYTHGAPTTAWNVAFPPPFWTNQTYFYTNWPAGVYNNMGMKLTVSGIKLLFLSYHTDASTNSLVDGVYTNQSAQIKAVMDANPDYNVIVCGHFFLGQSSTSYFDVVPSYQDHSTTYSNYVIGPGKAPIDSGLHQRPNSFMFWSGHNVPLLKGVYGTDNQYGNRVTFCQFNTQQCPGSRNCDYVNVYTFDTAKATVEGRTYMVSSSAWLGDYDRTGTFTNAFFPSGFTNNFQAILPVRPYTYPVFSR